MTSFKIKMDTLQQKFLPDLAMPLIDLCIAAETGLAEARGHLCAFCHTLAERVHEVKFRIDLVQRYVESIDCNKEFEHTRIAHRTNGGRFCMNS